MMPWAALAFGLVLVLLTPEEVSPALYWLHMMAAIYLYVAAGIGAIWIIMRDGKSRLDRVLFWILMIGSAMSLLSLSYIHILGVLAFGQVLALNAGVLIIIRATLRWAGEKVKE